MNATLLRRRLGVLERKRGLAPIVGDADRWATLNLPESFFGRQFQHRGQLAVRTFATARGLREDRVVPCACRGVVQTARMVLLETMPPAIAEERLVAFVSELQRDMLDAGLSPDEMAEALRELSDPAIRSWSRKKEIDFEGLAKVQRQLLGLAEEPASPQ